MKKKELVISRESLDRVYCEYVSELKREDISFSFASALRNELDGFYRTVSVFFICPDSYYLDLQELASEYARKVDEAFEEFLIKE